MNNPNFFKVATFILKQVLNCYYAPFLRLGGYKWYAYKGGIFSSLMLAKIMTWCYQSLQTGYFGNDKPASSTSLSQLKIRWVFQDQYFYQVRALEAESNELFFTIFFCEKPMSANWLWSWPIDPDFLEEGNDKDLRMIRCRLTKIFNPEYNLSSLFLCLFYRISWTWINPN